MRRASTLAVVLLAALGLGSASARAEGSELGSANIERLGGTDELEAHIEVGFPREDKFSCTNPKASSPDAGCYWFGEASEYPAQDGCPSEFAASRGIWIGNVEDGFSIAAFGTTTFTPSAKSIVVCIYIDVEGDVILEGDEHFGSEPGYRRYQAKTTVWVTVRGCNFYTHVAVNGKTRVGGEVTRVLRRYREHLQATESLEEASGWYKHEPPGRYSFSARFLGDSHLLPSLQPATAYFTLKRCQS